MRLRLNKNITEDWANISERYGAPASQLIGKALVDMAKRNLHPTLTQDVAVTGSVGGTAYSGRPIAKNPDDSTPVMVRVSLTDQEQRQVKAYLGKSNVPLTLAQAIAAVRLYYLGAITEAELVYNLG